MIVAAKTLTLSLARLAFYAGLIVVALFLLLSSCSPRPVPLTPAPTWTAAGWTCPAGFDPRYRPPLIFWWRGGDVTCESVNAARSEFLELERTFKPVGAPVACANPNYLEADDCVRDPLLAPR